MFSGQDEANLSETARSSKSNNTLLIQEISSILTYVVESSISKYYKIFLFSILLVLIAYSFGIWWIAYKTSKEQAGRLNVYEERMTSLAKNLENLRSENIAQIQIMSNALDGIIEGIVGIEHSDLQGRSLSYSSEGTKIHTPVDDLIEHSFDATIDPIIKKIPMPELPPKE